MIAEEVGRELGRRGLTLAVAESCTGGLISDMITDVPGSSGYFLAGLVTYGDRSKMELLGVSEASLIRYGAVSAQVVKEMAEGARAATGADIGLSATGIAGPGGGNNEKPVGLVHFALSHGGKMLHQQRMFSGDRRGVKRAASEHALGMLLSLLRQLAAGEKER
jgi:PncC family amidohydrolase